MGRVVFAIWTENYFVDDAALDGVAARNLLAIHHQERIWMCARPAGDHDNYQIADQWNVNLKIESAHERLAVEQQLRSASQLSLRIQVLAVRGPLRSASLVRRWLAVHNQHPGPLPPVRIIPDVGVMVPVRAEGETVYARGRNVWFAVENKTAYGLVDRLSLVHLSDIEKMHAV